MDAPRLAKRQLGRTQLHVTPIGFGAFKIGRNVGIKYERDYALPSDDESDRLLHAVVDELGINYIDTAPAYGLSETRVGRALGSRRDVIISTKVGETFINGASRFDFSADSVRRSIRNSSRQLQRDTLDLVFVHSDGNDLDIQSQTDIVGTLQQLKTQGDIRFIGFSGKTIEGARAALVWADVIMVEYHMANCSHDQVMREAHDRTVGVVVKKGLASGRLPSQDAVRFVLAHPATTCMVIGGLNISHLQSNVAAAIA